MTGVFVANAQRQFRKVRLRRIRVEAYPFLGVLVVVNDCNKHEYHHNNIAYIIDSKMYMLAASLGTCTHETLREPVHT